MAGGPNAKRFMVAGPWDLEIPTNVIIHERKPILLPHPHPEIEIVRFNYVMKLRQSYQEMCHSREGKNKSDTFYLIHISQALSWLVFLFIYIVSPCLISAFF